MSTRKINKPHKKKLKTIALSVLLAIILWFMVIYVNDPDITTTVSNIDVRFIGESELRDRDIALTGRDNIPPISMVVTGKRSDLMNFIDDIYVQVNVSDIDSAGEFNLSGSISVPTTRITVEKENYSNIPIKAEELIEKEVDVTVKQTGTLKNKLVQSLSDTSKVMISGAASEINEVQGAVATVDISEIKEDNTQKVNYLLTDSAGEFISENETIESARPYVVVNNTIYDMKTLPIVPALSAELEKDYILNAEKTVAAPSSVTVGVNADNNDEKIVARIDALYEEGAGEYSLESPNGVYIPPESKKVKVKTETVKKTSADIEISVEAENVPEGHKVKIEDKLNVHVIGEEGRINSDNVKAFVDLSGLGRGEHTLPVRLTGENMEFPESYTINVIIE